MARMPGADWLGEHSPETPMSAYDIVCVHTIVGYAPAHAAHFSTWGTGRIGQSRDTRYRSAANLNGNHRIIAIENADHGAGFPTWTGSNVPPLTDAQVVSNGKILAWSHDEHGVPLQLCPDSRPGSRGLAYHRQGIDGNFGTYRYPGRVAGGELWTKHFGKVCPGDRRIAQLPDILDAALTIKRGGSLTLEEDVTPEDIEKVVDAVFRRPMRMPDGEDRSFDFFLRHMNVELDRLKAMVDADALAGRVAAKIPTGSPLDLALVKQAVLEAIDESVVSVDINVNTKE